jgi:UDP-hydrolysing UDP-N-acetyl-D-glucosamine 2-epimerase
MIGDGWTNPQDERRRDARPTPDRPRRVAVVTGSRADFGLLAPVMSAIDDRPELELLVIAAGTHLIQPALTFRDVKKRFAVADTVPMQIVGRSGRGEDVQATARGLARFGRSFERLGPDWVVVLGDRIEAFAAAAAGSIGGRAVAHLHGGDVAEGVADEAMRHAITKLAHLHLPASEASAARIRAMGEPERFVRVVGSPAIDGLDAIEPIDDASWDEMGRPEALFCMHPVGRTDEAEEHASGVVLSALAGQRVLALHPNHDPGRDGIMRTLMSAPGEVRIAEHVPRHRFVRTIARLARENGVVVGNSSAGLIEIPALGCPVVDVGPRQAGRETPDGVVRVPHEDADAVRHAIAHAVAHPPSAGSHPFGDGRTGPRVAESLCAVNPYEQGLLRKRWESADDGAGVDPAP